MCEEVKILKSDAIAAYKKADAGGKKLLENLLGADGKKIFNQVITDSIKDFSDICELAGTNEFTFRNKYNHLSDSKYALEQMELITIVLNEGWTPNWGDVNEKKWFPWFLWGNLNNKSGFGFALASYGCDCTYTTVGSRLVFKTCKLAEFAGIKFENIYNEYLK